MALKMIVAAALAFLAAVWRCQGEMAARVETFAGPGEGEELW